jgi:alpha-beta hydrolase superfamily lysophospholipase
VVAEEPGRQWTETTLLTEDSVRLRVRRSIHPAGADAIVVVAHGFAASLEHPDVRSLADLLFEADLDVVTYDARGHGQSEGRCGVGSTEHHDVACLVSHVAAADLPVLVVGVSMGAIAVVSYLAGIQGQDPAVVGAVLVSAPSRWRMRPSAVGLLNVVLTRSAVGRWAAGKWLGVRIRPGWWPGEAPELAMNRIGIPVVVVHGANDRLLASSHAHRLHGSGAASNRLQVVEGMGHGLDKDGQGAVLDAVEWLLSARDETEVVSRAG